MKKFIFSKNVFLNTGAGNNNPNVVFPIADAFSEYGLNYQETYFIKRITVRGQYEYTSSGEESSFTRQIPLNDIIIRPRSMYNDSKRIILSNGQETHIPIGKDIDGLREIRAFVSLPISLVNDETNGLIWYILPTDAIDLQCSLEIWKYVESI